MRTTVDLDPGLLRRLRAEAHRRAVPLKQLLNQVIRLGLDAPSNAEPYECPTYAMGRPVSSVNLDKALQLAAGLEDEETAREMELRK
jgi:hypothetical protein